MLAFRVSPAPSSRRQALLRDPRDSAPVGLLIYSTHPSLKFLLFSARTAPCCCGRYNNAGDALCSDDARVCKAQGLVMVKRLDQKYPL